MNPSLKRTPLIHLAAASLLFLIGTGVGRAQVQLNLQPGVQLSWPAPNTTNTYHLQWSSNPVSTWADLVAPIAGDGTTHTFFDPVPSGYRLYQDLEIVPGTAPSAALPANSGFEIGNGTTASNWVTDTAVGGPVYGIRTNDSPHGGSFNYQVHLASTGAGPLVQFSQSGVPVAGGTTYPFNFWSKALAGSQGYNAQWRILWNAGGDTGYQTFTPGNGSYAQFNTSVTAPASATSATIYFHIAGAAVTNFSANLDFDDVVLGSGGSGSGTPAATNVLQVSAIPMANISWVSSNAIPYYAESTTNLTGPWTNNFGLFLGNGSTMSFLAPMTNSAMFFHLRTPPLTVLPPTNLHQVPSGLTNAIGVAWTASISPGVNNYRMSYGDINTTTTNTTDLGNVTSTVISGLTSGETYFVSIIAISANGQSDPAAATITAQPDTDIGIIPLFDAFTSLEPDTVYDTSSNHVTRISDRPRLRHAREDGSRDNPPDFSLYDTYAIFYWQQRMTTIEIDDFVAKGGSSVLFHMWSLNGLDTPNIRFFFQGQTTVAQYGDNEFANQADSSLTNWTFNLTHNGSGGALHTGDKIEIEFSPFMLTVTNGQLNYYGGAILYIVGQGIVPWGTVQNPIDLNPANDGPIVNGVRVNIDSNPLPTNAWSAGTSTMPYQYSGEPTHLFNQLSPGASPPSGEPFLLGRRLHHTDFGTGAHVGDEVDAGGGNGTFTQQVGKLGPKFTNRSCIACHVNNGRALPPAIGAPMLQSVVHVASDASGTPDPVYGSVLQPQITSGTPEGTCVISSYTTINGTYGDSTPYTLQKPNYTFSPHTPAFYSVRVAPQLVGMGLLEAVDESTIEALADPGDSDADGISGKVRTVTDPETGQLRLGRFTYRGGQARVKHQVAAALNNDMGVTTSVFPVLDGDTNSGPVELSDSDLTNWVRYVQALGVNARRDVTNSVNLQGQALFGSASCWKCHTPTITTSPHHPMAELRNQTIHPYTDLLLHDMGPGLADNLGEGNATGSEWRTSPLWSIGLTPSVNGGEAYLHDGRARSLEEAILWHDGEAAASREAFRNMSASDRAALIAFLKSL
ncbi:MAG TPA: di-heme oxidoredictase family protein [Verrucomicrobiae bacterium]|nr:di-heme oxidoredictase family protein [Verrucomicrobiae bacterium]